MVCLDQNVQLKLRLHNFYGSVFGLALFFIFEGLRWLRKQQPAESMPTAQPTESMAKPSNGHLPKARSVVTTTVLVQAVKNLQQKYEQGARLGAVEARNQ